MDFLRSLRLDGLRKRRAQRDYIRAVDAIPYHLQGPEVSAIADGIREEHRSGALGYDAGTYMEAARHVLNRLSEAGYIVVPVPARPTSEGEA